MIKDAADKFQFVDKIIQFLPHYNFNISVHADNAVRIKNVRERFLRILKDENPDGFIFMIGNKHLSFYSYLFYLFLQCWYVFIIVITIIIAGTLIIILIKSILFFKFHCLPLYFNNPHFSTILLLSIPLPSRPILIMTFNFSHF